MTDRHKINVLFCEDNHGDIRLAREVMEETGIQVILNTVRNGEETMAYLRQQKTTRTMCALI